MSGMRHRVDMRIHGSRQRYLDGCRCDRCVGAWKFEATFSHEANVAQAALTERGITLPRCGGAA